MAPEGNVFKTLVNGMVAMAKNVGIDYLSVQGDIVLGFHFPSFSLGENL